MAIDKEKLKRQTKEVIDNCTKEDLKKVKKNINIFIEFYKNICPSCRSKVLKNTAMSLNEYCEKCQNKWHELAKNGKWD